eukprot:scaffold826_cov335-Pavlova_lutheri.AAC.13
MEGCGGDPTSHPLLDPRDLPGSRPPLPSWIPGFGLGSRLDRTQTIANRAKKDSAPRERDGRDQALAHPHAKTGTWEGVPRRRTRGLLGRVRSRIPRRTRGGKEGTHGKEEPVLRALRRIRQTIGRMGGRKQSGRMEPEPKHTHRCESVRGKTLARLQERKHHGKR